LRLNNKKEGGVRLFLARHHLFYFEINLSLKIADVLAASSVSVAACFVLFFIFLDFFYFDVAAV
jgi:hypothetical protein